LKRPFFISSKKDQNNFRKKFVFFSQKTASTFSASTHHNDENPSAPESQLAIKKDFFEQKKGFKRLKLTFFYNSLEHAVYN